MMSKALLAILILSLIGGADVLAVEQHTQALIDAYKTRPQGYPKLENHRAPLADPSHRFHFYRKDAIDRHDGVDMIFKSDVYNGLDGRGVSCPPEIRIDYTPLCVTHGKRSLRVQFPRASSGGEQLAIEIKQSDNHQVEIGGSTHVRETAWTPNYSFLMVDVWNPHEEKVRVRFAGFAYDLESGHNVLMLKLADLATLTHPGGVFSSFLRKIRFSSLEKDREVELYLDHVRLVQESPSLLASQGRMFHFTGKLQNKLYVWPGHTPILANTLYDKNQGYGWLKVSKQRRSYTKDNRGSRENGFLNSQCVNTEGTFRMDLPNGKYGVFVLAHPLGTGGFFKWDSWEQGVRVSLNGKLVSPLVERKSGFARKKILEQEDWEFRPGACIWQNLYRENFFPFPEIQSVSVDQGVLDIAFPKWVRLSSIVVFPLSEKSTALRELGRWNYLMALSWDTAHPWVAGMLANAIPYVGAHEELEGLEVIERKIRALDLQTSDFRRGFTLFRRNLIAPIYHDTIPAKEEGEMSGLAFTITRGAQQSRSLGIFPLRKLRAIQVRVEDLRHENGEGLESELIDVRFSRYQHSTMEYAHGNVHYNMKEHYLLKKKHVDLYPGVCRRVVIDIRLSHQALPGRYRGKLLFASDESTEHFSLPVSLRVLPIALEKPPVYFGVSRYHPAYKTFGINTYGASYRQAKRLKLENVVNTDPIFAGQRIHLHERELLKHMELFQKSLDDQREGRGPKVFWGFYWNAKTPAEKYTNEISWNLPDLNYFGGNMDTYALSVHSAWGRCWTPEWRSMSPPKHLGHLARQPADRPFWFIDRLKTEKAHASRFTFGFWLWRSGAAGRYTSVHGEGYTHDIGYYTLEGLSVANANRALMESKQSGVVNHSRGLLAIREGIDDYRTLYTLEQYIERLEEKHSQHDDHVEARSFLSELKAEIDLNLNTYYEHRSGSYAEDWFIKAAAWDGAKFDRLREEAYGHILKLMSLERV